jgi:hypothetical protein
MGRLMHGKMGVLIYFYRMVHETKMKFMKIIQANLLMRYAKRLQIAHHGILKTDWQALAGA